MQRTTSESDWQLLKAAKRDSSALTELFVRHKDYVYRLAWGFIGDRVSAEDAVQEVFMRLSRMRGGWIVRAKFTTWLYKVTLNVSRELIRKHRPVGGARRDDVISPPDEPERGVVLSELSAALERLPARQREVVVLRMLEGLSTRETAQVVGCREGTVKVHLHRGLAALKSDPAINPIQ